VVAVNADNKEDRELVSRFARRNKLTHLILVGGEQASEQYGTEQVLPTTFWIDHRGRVARRETGFRPEMVKEMERTIEELLRARNGEGKPAETAESSGAGKPSGSENSGNGDGPAEPEKGGVPPGVLQKMQELYFQASDLYEKNEHRKAIQAYRGLLKIIPAGKEFQRLRGNTHYLIAANHSILGEGREALLQLNDAVDHGFLDKRKLIYNKDFDSIRNLEDYKRLLEKMGRMLLPGLSTFDFSLVLLDGKPIKKKDYLGQVLVINIWGTWCHWCHKEIPHLTELYRRYGSQGLRIVGFADEGLPDAGEAGRRVEEFIRRNKIPFPSALVTADFLNNIPGFDSYPTTLIFGRDGEPRAMERGARDLEALERIVKPLLAESGTGASR